MLESDHVILRSLTIFGIFLYISGILGNLLNIFVFTCWCNRRQRNTNSIGNNNNVSTSNSPIYLCLSSYVNLIEIFYPLLIRIIYDGFQYPKSSSNEFYTCKFRQYVLHTTDMISLACICMAVLDRFLTTSRQAHLRRLTLKRKQTKFFICFLIILTSLHNIPILFYAIVSPTGECLISSQIYLYYYLFITQICCHGLIPIIFLSIFGYLTYKQLKSLPTLNNRRNYNSDKQLSRMLLLLSIVILISSIPYCIQHIYSILTASFNQYIDDYELLFYYLALLLFFANPSLSFYIFFLSTPNFRKQLKIIFFCKINQRNIFNNRVNTITTENDP